MKHVMEWSDKLSIGIETIDEQHKTLIQRINHVAAALANNQGEKEVASTLDFLIRYTHYHFDKEEAYMKEYNYPGLEEQQEKHEALKVILCDLEEEFIEDGATKTLASSIDTFLVNWLQKHIEGVDLKFGEFLKKNKIEIPLEEED